MKINKEFINRYSELVESSFCRYRDIMIFLNSIKFVLDEGIKSYERVNELEDIRDLVKLDVLKGLVNKIQYEIDRYSGLESEKRCILFNILRHHNLLNKYKLEEIENDR